MNRTALQGAMFRTASGCGDKSCVAVAMADGVVGVRNTTDGDGGPVLVFTEKEWGEFLGGAKSGEFDLPQ